MLRFTPSTLGLAPQKRSSPCAIYGGYTTETIQEYEVRRDVHDCTILNIVPHPLCPGYCCNHWTLTAPPMRTLTSKAGSQPSVLMLCSFNASRFCHICYSPFSVIAKARFSMDESKFAIPNSCSGPDVACQPALPINSRPETPTE